VVQSVVRHYTERDIPAILVHTNMGPQILSFRVRTLPTYRNLMDKAPGNRNYCPHIHTHTHCTVVRQIACLTEVVLTIVRKPSSVPDGAKFCHHPTALPFNMCIMAAFQGLRPAVRMKTGEGKHSYRRSSAIQTLLYNEYTAYPQLLCSAFWP
jgi:hypothetical protein